MKREVERRWGWVVAEILESPPMPPRPDEMLVRITEVGGETFIALIPRSEVRLDSE
ncbi:hypothetical protein LCGC14_0458050 [marine sediment metagenome]|uniref:Uncharacterized protein n=1 Tax=marine sediment metagenome TaxID=412755 RepID=A0A0F9SYV9_9ZZZZ